ncbi:MAG: hypothetical protein KF790_06295 [Steroidobacteraceae bacterium]|nr:hypothetical protein [Steroidobacteraceae bacterium]MCW5571526.1 hypothetical protein [Steroidobacteraceae bacterium]
MKLLVRRVGNSLGVIIPKAQLDQWGVAEGDHLRLTDGGIAPPACGGLSHRALDELKRRIALAVIRDFTPRQIRAQIVANLHRWKEQGMWIPAYDEWRALALGEEDGALLAAMLGRDENAVRLRQSMPFVGLLSPEEVTRLHEEMAR